MSLLNIGMSGLSASQTSLMTTGNNIANADTAGYSRQQTVQGSKASNQYGNVFIGSGTTLADVRRVYNSYLDAQLQTTTSLNSDAAAYLGQITPVDKLLSDSGTGITGALTKFFASMQNVNAKPADDASRQLLLSDAQALSNRFNSVSSQLNEQNANINGNLSSMADQVNKLAATVAQLNQKISEVSSGGGMPNDLLDARNETLRQLSTFVKVDVSERGSSVDLYLGSGQPLVVGNTSSKLEVVAGKTDPTRSSLQLNRGSSTIDVTSVVTGGEIGGLLRYRNEVLDPAMNELGRVALVIADQVNSQLGQGIDKNGEFGAALFNNINSAALISQRSIANGNNSAGSGNLDVTIKDTGKLTISDYQVTFTSATDYTVKRSDGTSLGAFSTTTTPPPVIDGFTLSLNGGAMSAGDSFKITPTRNAATTIKTELTDAKRLAIAAPLNAEVLPGATGSLSIPGLPTVKPALDIYNSAANAEMQTAIKNSVPVKLVFDAPAGGSQGYKYYDAKGTLMGTGSIVPGQNNTLNLQIKMVDASGNPITDGGTPPVQKTFTVEMSVAGSPKEGEGLNVKFN
ncbi:MAG: flagellar hook-associated protein FlgK, partial [Pseudomonas chlororaphis]